MKLRIDVDLCVNAAELFWACGWRRSSCCMWLFRSIGQLSSACKNTKKEKQKGNNCQLQSFIWVRCMCVCVCEKYSTILFSLQCLTTRLVNLKKVCWTLFLSLILSLIRYLFYYYAYGVQFRNFKHLLKFIFMMSAKAHTHTHTLYK